MILNYFNNFILTFWLFQESSESSHLNYGSDITSYQTSLEDVLTWLLEDEEKLKEQSIADNLDGIKEQFHEHEV